MEISDRVILAGLIYFMKLKGGSDSAFTPDLDPNARPRRRKIPAAAKAKTRTKIRIKEHRAVGTDRARARKITNSSAVNFEGSWNNLLLQQKYYRYNDGYSYSQWIRDMRSGKTDGRFSVAIHGVNLPSPTRASPACRAGT